MKNFKELIAQLAEAQVSTNKYSWGTMKTVHDGSKTSYPLHPEHQAIVKRLRPSGEHAKAMYKDETGAQVHVHREGDKVHFVSHKKSGSHKTTVDYKHFDEEVEQIEEGDLSVRTLYNKFADAHVNGHDTKSTEKVIRKVHGDEVMNHMKKAAKANAKADIDSEERHFDNAQTAAKKTDRIGGTVGRGRSEFMRKRREWSESKDDNGHVKKMLSVKEEVELDESLFADKEQATSVVDKLKNKHDDGNYSIVADHGKHRIVHAYHSDSRVKKDIAKLNEEQAPVAPVPDRKYIKGTPENKALRAKKSTADIVADALEAAVDGVDKRKK
jgi:hypothetical protein